MLSRLRQMLIKEFIQVLRDRQLRFILIVPPIVQMVVFGYAATFEVHHVRTALLDFDHSQESRELVSRFVASGRFDIGAVLANARQIAPTIDRARAALVLRINAGFARRLRKGQTARLQVILDAAHSNTALIALSYINRIAQRYALDYQDDRMRRLAPRLAAFAPDIELERRPWFNTDLESRAFFVPGVIGSLTLILTVTLTAFAVVREREVGTLEQIMVTPIRPLEFILGKTVPFFLISLGDVILIALVGTLWFQIPFAGSFGVLMLGAVLFLLSMLGVGLFISTICATQQQALVSAFFFVMPAITLSGFGFPIASMPTPMQWFTYLDPLRYVLVVLRGTFLKGVGLGVLWPQMVAMAAIGLVLLGVSALRFRKSLE